MKRVLFVPYALHDRDAYARTAREKFESLGKAGRPRGRRLRKRRLCRGAAVPQGLASPGGARAGTGKPRL